MRGGEHLGVEVEPALELELGRAAGGAGRCPDVALGQLLDLEVELSVTAMPSVPAYRLSAPPVTLNGPGRSSEPPVMTASMPTPPPLSTRSTSTRSEQVDARPRILPRPTKPVERVELEVGHRDRAQAPGVELRRDSGLREDGAVGQAREAEQGDRERTRVELLALGEGVALDAAHLARAALLAETREVDADHLEELVAAHRLLPVVEQLALRVDLDLLDATAALLAEDLEACPSCREGAHARPWTAPAAC